MEEDAEFDDVEKVEDDGNGMGEKSPSMSHARLPACRILPSCATRISGIR